MYKLEILDDPFDGDDLEWKVQTCGIGNNGKAWALIVPYVANRAIMSRLDRAVGKLNWKNEFRDIGGNGVECGIAIRCPETKEWIWKYDAAECSDIEAVKGGRSNSMKRAAVQWGMGRHLYHVGETWADCSMDRQSGAEWTRARTKDKKEFWWRVPSSTNKAPVPSSEAKQNQQAPVASKVISEAQLSRLMAIANEFKVTQEQQVQIVKEQFGFDSRKLITTDKYDAVVKAYQSINQLN